MHFFFYFEPLHTEGHDESRSSAGPQAATAVGVAQPLHEYPLAKCLDGSPGRYYIRGAAGARARADAGAVDKPVEARKFIVYHEGGGFCTGMKDCTARASTYLGSTASDTGTMALTDPYFGQDPRHNPLLHNWTLVYVRYCDGACVAKRQPTNWIGNAWGRFLIASSRYTHAPTRPLGGCGGAGDTGLPPCTGAGRLIGITRANALVR